MKILRQKEFNSKPQKKRRRYEDIKIGDERISKLAPGSAEDVYYHGKANYPGEIVKSVEREGDNWHFKNELRPGVSHEKAAELERRAAKMKETNPKWSAGTRRIIAGRDIQNSTEGFSKDKSRVNQRINARSLGDSSLKEDLKDPEIKAKVQERLNKKKAKVVDAVEKKGKDTLKKSSTLKKLGIGAIATGGVAAAGYGAKKLYNKKKSKKEEVKEK